MGGSIRLRKAEVTRYVTKLREHPCTSMSGRNGLVWDRTTYGCMYVTKGANGLVWDRTTYGCMYVTKGTNGLGQNDKRLGSSQSSRNGLVWNRMAETARYATKRQARPKSDKNN